MTIGNVSSKMQWGSNSDIKRDDGYIINKSFSFQCKMQASISDFEEIEVIEDSLVIDTEDFFNARYGQDEFDDMSSY